MNNFQEMNLIVVANMSLDIPIWLRHIKCENQLDAAFVVEMSARQPPGSLSGWSADHVAPLPHHCHRRSSRAAFAASRQPLSGCSSFATKTTCRCHLHPMKTTSRCHQCCRCRSWWCLGYWQRGAPPSWGSIQRWPTHPPPPSNRWIPAIVDAAFQRRF
jgi:hypothetical protein